MPEYAAIISFGQLPWLAQIYVLLLTAGALVLLCALVSWSRTGMHDPLRGSPLRANHLGLQHVWLCLAGFFVGLWIGAGIERLLAPRAPESVASIVGSSASNVLVIIVCLGVGHYTFLGGLRGFGIGRRSAGVVVGYAVAGWVAALAVCEGVTWIVLVVLRWIAPHYTPPEHTVFQALQDPAVPSWIRVIAILGAAVLAPVGEELMFRGVLQTGLKKVMPCRPGWLIHRWLAILVTAALFGAMHSGTPQYVPALIALGLILGFLYERTGSLLVPILLHMLFNGRSLLWYSLQG